MNRGHHDRFSRLYLLGVDYTELWQIGGKERAPMNLVLLFAYVEVNQNMYYHGMDQI